MTLRRYFKLQVIKLVTQLERKYISKQIQNNNREKYILTSGYLIPPSVTLILLISSGERIPNWTLFTVFTGALESLVMIDVILDVLSETF